MSLVHAVPPPLPSPKIIPQRARSNSSALSTPTSSFSSSSSSDDEALTPASSTHRLDTRSSLSHSGTPRKIRFAPLPDIRRDDQDDDDDILLQPLSRSASIDNIPAPLLSVHPASPVHPLTPAASPGLTPVNLPSTPDLPCEHPKHHRWSFLKPFSRRSSLSSPTPSSSSFNISTESLLTLGTINLFRTSSRESRRSVHSTVSECSPLGRFSGALRREASLPRSQSLITPQTIATPNRPRAGSGTRLLNGRVYGRKRPHSVSDKNPFANARDEEPSFVEWGYGGMGSVNNNAGHDRWNKLQSGGTGLTLHQEDEDDGSGAAWVRKRKQERAAREKFETEAKLTVEKDKAERSDAISEPPCKSSSNETSTNVSAQHNKDHVTSAVTVPAPSQIQRRHSTKSHTSVDHAVNIVETKPVLQKRSSTSSEEEDGDDSEQSEDDSEEEEFENSRRTALGAGVEKIRRHNN